MSKSLRIYILLALTALCLLTLAFVPAIPQEESYHNFADQRTLYGINNFWNVTSNALFVILGINGLRRAMLSSVVQKPSAIVLSLGVALVGFGSAWYHYAPSNQTLLWDRLPMTIVFMSFFSIVIRNFIDKKAGDWLLYPLVGIGLLSVLYWYFTEMRGAGDLRPYAFIQFYPMIAIPVILILFKAGRQMWRSLGLIIISYVLAKVFEHFDDSIFQQSHWISGHSLKHIVAALATGWMIAVACRTTE